MVSSEAWPFIQKVGKRGQISFIRVLWFVIDMIQRLTWQVAPADGEQLVITTASPKRRSCASFAIETWGESCVLTGSMKHKICKWSQRSTSWMDRTLKSLWCCFIPPVILSFWTHWVQADSSEVLLTSVSSSRRFPSAQRIWFSSGGYNQWKPVEGTTGCPLGALSCHTSHWCQLKSLLVSAVSPETTYISRCLVTPREILARCKRAKTCEGARPSLMAWLEATWVEPQRLAMNTWRSPRYLIVIENL